MKIYCIPAGGTNPFQVWNKMVNSEIKIETLNFPGRGNRIREKEIQDINELTSVLTEDICNNTTSNEPYCIFGYCFGAIIGYEICMKLKENNKHLPKYFLAFGAEAPNAKKILNQNENVDTEEFRKIVAQFLSPLAIGSEEAANKAQESYIREYKKRLSSIKDIHSKDVFDDLNDDNMFELDMMLNLLNSSLNQIELDNKMLNDYYTSDKKTICIDDIKAKIIYGKEDSFLEEQDVILWKECFKESEIIYISGNHYSIMDTPKNFIDIINEL